MKSCSDTALAVHSDLKSHMGATFTMGIGAIVSVSRKKKTNTKSIMETELLGVDDVSSLILRTNIFRKHKDINPNKTFYIKKIKVLSYYRNMVKIVRVKGQNISS